MKTLTMKFGGTSVGSVAAVEHLVDIVQQVRADHVQGIVVVVSAMSGVTDQLQAGILGAADGDPQGHHVIGRALREKHLAVLQALASDACEPVMDEIDALLQSYVRFCDSVYVLGETTPRALDHTLGLGERMSARQVAAALRTAGVPAQAVDATALIVTDDRFQDAVPDLALTRRNIQAVLVPILEAGDVPVITGFIGATADGISTTLGRGGSDYSAAIIGACLGSDELWIWTDVDGVMSADPRIVPEACTLEVLSYREVGELAYYGAKVLHPKTIRPVLEAGIPIRVKNTFNAGHPGTLILPDGAGDGQPIRAVTAIKEVGIINVEGKGMLGVPGIAARTFGAVARTRTSVLLISQASSEQSISFIVPRASAATVVDALNAEFEREIERRDIDRVTSKDPVTIVTAVGAGMIGVPGIAGKIFTEVARAGVNILAIAQGSSECSISFAVNAQDGDTAVRAVHTLTQGG